MTRRPARGVARSAGAGLAVAFATLLLTAPPAAAHFGVGLRPYFTEPVGLVVVDGSEPLTFAWTALEEHPEVEYVFSYQAGDLPPTPAAPRRWRVGTPWATTAADALEKAIAWDLTDVPSGAWRVYAEFEEPPFCVDIELAPTLVVVRRPGEAAPFGVIVTEPFDESTLVEDAAPIRIEAIAPSAVTVTVEAGDLIVDPDFPPNTLCSEVIWTPTRTVLADVALVADAEAGPDRWRLDADWDVSEVPNGAYLLRVTARDADGAEVIAYARRWINVEREAPGADGGPTEPGAEVAEVAEPGPPRAAGGGCAGGPVDASGWALLFMVWLGAGLGCRRWGRGQVH